MLFIFFLYLRFLLSNVLILCLSNILFIATFTVCDDLDLCGNCADAGMEPESHTNEHAMQVLPAPPMWHFTSSGLVSEGPPPSRRHAGSDEDTDEDEDSDGQVLFGSRKREYTRLEWMQRHVDDFTCPLCSDEGYCLEDFIDHVADEHPGNSSRSIICPVCVALPGGDSNHRTHNLGSHLSRAHDPSAPGNRSSNTSNSIGLSNLSSTNVFGTASIPPSLLSGGSNDAPPLPNPPGSLFGARASASVPPSLSAAEEALADLFQHLTQARSAAGRDHSLFGSSSRLSSAARPQGLPPRSSANDPRRAQPQRSTNLVQTTLGGGDAAGSVPPGMSFGNTGPNFSVSASGVPGFFRPDGGALGRNSGPFGSRPTPKKHSLGKLKPPSVSVKSPIVFAKDPPPTPNTKRERKQKRTMRSMFVQDLLLSTLLSSSAPAVNPLPNDAQHARSPTCRWS